MSHEFIPRKFRVKLTFFPAISMVQTSAMSLAKELSSRTALSDIHIGDEAWSFNQKSQTEREPRGKICVNVKESELEIDHRFPATGLEQYERLLGQVFESFQEPLSPDFVFQIEIDLTYVFDLKIDSRHSMLSELGLTTEDESVRDRVQEFERPCFQVGLRLNFPPYEVEDEAGPPNQDAENQSDVIPVNADAADPPSREADTIAPVADWNAVVTILTLPEEANKVSVQINGIWHGPNPWSKIQEAVQEKMSITESFLKDKVKRFLGHFRGQGDEGQN